MIHVDISDIPMVTEIAYCCPPKYGPLDNSINIQASLMKLVLTGGKLDYACHLLLMWHEKPVSIAWNWRGTNMHL